MYSLMTMVVMKSKKEFILTFDGETHGEKTMKITQETGEINGKLNAWEIK